MCFQTSARHPVRLNPRNLIFQITRLERPPRAPVESPTARAAREEAARKETTVGEKYDLAMSQLRALDKKLFYNEALLKGHPAPSERDSLKEAIAKLKEDKSKLQETITGLDKQLQQVPAGSH
jgi:hypothetical protein